MTNNSKLWQKILATQQQIAYVKKGGKNSSQNYTFLTETQALEEVRKKAHDNGLIITTSTIEAETGTFQYESYNSYQKTNVTKFARYAKVKTEHRIIDAETGDFDTVYSQGYAEDSGDKPLTKAITSSTKYFMMKYFMIPTGDDIENNDGQTASNNQPPTTDAPMTAANAKSKLMALAKNVGISVAKVKEITGLDMAKNHNIQDLQMAYNHLNNYIDLTNNKG